ncbi:MAG: hypothetical protein P8Y53_03435 [Pseudolabrys sp.]
MTDLVSRPPSRVLPIILCPVCVKPMRLSTIIPEHDNRERMTFACDCGFTYQQSEAVAAERKL